MTTSWVEVSRSPAHKTAADHSLVLEARGIVSAVAVASGLHVVIVRVEDAERARAEIANFVRENQVVASDDDAPPPIGWSVGAALCYVVVLVVFDLAQRRDGFGLDWRQAGLADAGMIRDGAWWRSITALFLHADVLHLASNLAFGALFGVMLAQSVGFGLAWLAFVVTGGIGNGSNAWLQAPSHASLGASTAVFGMLGVQVAHDWVRRRQLHYNVFRRWAPVAIGAALLGWLGGDGSQIDPNGLPKTLGDLDVALPRIDVWAHVLGFASGLALGGLVGWSRPRIRLTPWMQAALYGTAVGIASLAWAFALR